jgi:hypothetical protein
LIIGENAKKLQKSMAAFACRALNASYNAALPALIG